MHIDPQTLVHDFKQRFGAAPVLYRAPGRINLIGEHTDYNDGFVMPTNTAVYTWLAAWPRQDRMIRIHSALFEETIAFDLDAIRPGGAPAWAEYAKGVAFVLQDEGHELRGADLLISGEIPLGGGMSSSASLEAVIATALLDCAGRQEDPMKLALMCQRAEHEFAGVPCGIMDQAVITCCPQGHAMKLDCRSLQPQFIRLPQELCVLVVDTGVKHRLSDGGYEQRREECARAVAVLARHAPEVDSLRAASLEMVERHAAEMGEKPYRRARHVVSEIQRVLDAEAALASADLAALGALLDASHASLRDDFEVSCAELDFLAETASGTPGVLGARMVGGGFGGCVITLIEPARLEPARESILGRYTDYSGKEPWNHLVQPAPPAGRARQNQRRQRGNGDCL